MEVQWVILFLWCKTVSVRLLIACSVSLYSIANNSPSITMLIRQKCNITKIWNDLSYTTRANKFKPWSFIQLNYNTWGWKDDIESKWQNSQWDVLSSVCKTWVTVPQHLSSKASSSHVEHSSEKLHAHYDVCSQGSWIALEPSYVYNEIG